MTDVEDDDLPTSLADLLYEVEVHMRPLKTCKPNLALQLEFETQSKIKCDQNPYDAYRWQIEEAKRLLYVADTSIFDVFDENERADPLFKDDNQDGRKGGRPRATSRDFDRMFLRHMVASTSTVDGAVRNFLAAFPASPLTHEQLAARWRNRNR